MKVINARNVNDALYKGLQYLYENGVREESRAGPVLVAPEPVTTVYSHPQERVLFSAARDANPLFHLFESLWLIAGRDDARWLDQFVSDFSSRFAENDGALHGSYGNRWRGAFGFDQLGAVIKILKKDPTSRQCVLQMWDVSHLDLTGTWKDRPCNTHAYLRIRNEIEIVGASQAYGMGGAHQEQVPYLDITVCCRSNDVIWGAYGANAVQFSVLQEYLAARIGVGIGTYTQISNNYHMYMDMDERAKAILEEGAPPPYPALVMPIVTHPEEFDADLARFFTSYTLPRVRFKNAFFHEVAVPLIGVNKLWKEKKREAAINLFQQASEKLDNQDWILAVSHWMSRRMAKSAKTAEVWR